MPKTILLIDDDSDDFDFIKQGCEMVGFEDIIFYSNSAEAIKFLQSIEESSLPSLIVSDFNMPRENGFNLIEFLKTEKKFSSIRTVILSSKLSTIDTERFKAIGIDGIFVKPSQLQEYEKLCEELKEIAGIR